MTASRLTIAVCGGNTASADEARLAEETGAEIARHGAVLVCGGLGGVMEAACRGTVKGGGTTLGILPGEDRRAANEFVGLAVATNMGHARNAIIVHTADGVIAIGGEAGTLSEIALALKLRKPVVVLKGWDHLKMQSPAPHFDASPADAVRWILQQVEGTGR